MHTLAILDPDLANTAGDSTIKKTTPVKVLFTDKNLKYARIVSAEAGPIDANMILPAGARELLANAGGSTLMSAFADYLAGGQMIPAGTPDIAPGTNAFINLMKGSPLRDFSPAFLAGLAANAQEESEYCANNAGDKRKDVGGNGEYAITTNNCRGKRGEYCSFGYWQMNICATNAEGQLFAKKFGIDLNNKEELYKAITNPNKQFEFMRERMAALFPDLVYLEQMDGKTLGETAQHAGQEIASRFEKCAECKPGAPGNIARGLLAKSIIESGGSSPEASGAPPNYVSTATPAENFVMLDNPPTTTSEV
jgi:hypothetical protein